MMDVIVKTEWCAALRSGKYEQGRDVLRSSDDKFCCLGVLWDIEGDGWEDAGTDGDVNPTRYFAADRVSYLPSAFREKIGLTAADQSTLGLKNDKGEDFIAIADWIEANL